MAAHANLGSSPEDLRELSLWRREALRRFAATLLIRAPWAADRWREPATATGGPARLLLRRQQLWAALAAARVPPRLLGRPAPRLLRAADVPADPVANLRWYRTVEQLGEQLRRALLPAHLAERILDAGSSQALLLYRSLGGIRGLRRGLAAFVAWGAQHPASLGADARAACAQFLTWNAGLRALDWLELPSGRSPLDWAGLALPRDAPLRPSLRRDFDAAGARVRALRTPGEALEWFERMRWGESVWLAQAMDRLVLLFAFEDREGPLGLVVGDGLDERGWQLEALFGPGGSPASSAARRRAARWLEQARPELPPSAFGASGRDTN